MWRIFDISSAPGSHNSSVSCFQLLGSLFGSERKRSRSLSIKVSWLSNQVDPGARFVFVHCHRRHEQNHLTTRSPLHFGLLSFRKPKEVPVVVVQCYVWMRRSRTKNVKRGLAKNYEGLGLGLVNVWDGCLVGGWPTEWVSETGQREITFENASKNGLRKVRGKSECERDVATLTPFFVPGLQKIF